MKFIEDINNEFVIDVVFLKLKEKYFFIIGMFYNVSNVIVFVRIVKVKGVKIDMVYLQEMGYYYVYVLDYDCENLMLEELFEICEKIFFKDVWYKSGLKK